MAGNIENSSAIPSTHSAERWNLILRTETKSEAGESSQAAVVPAVAVAVYTEDSSFYRCVAKRI